MELLKLKNFIDEVIEFVNSEYKKVEFAGVINDGDIVKDNYSILLLEEQSFDHIYQLVKSIGDSDTYEGTYLIPYEDEKYFIINWKAE